MSKFLIVDNDPVTLTLITDALVNQTLFGKVITENNIITACDGLEAFGLLGKYKDINYIITEINTPGLGGDDLIELLHDTGKISNMDIVFICKECNLSILKKDYAKNILGSIPKPFNTTTFLTKLTELIRQKQEWKAHLEKLKPVWDKQKRFIAGILGEYISKTEQSHAIDKNKLNDILSGYIETEEITSYDELQYTLPTIVYEYAESVGVNFNLDTDLLSCIFNKFLFFETVHDESIILDMTHQALKKMMEKQIENDLTLEQILGFIFKEAITKLKEELPPLKAYGELNYKNFKPYVSKAMSFLERLDCKIHSPEIMESEYKIKLALKEYETIEERLYIPADAASLKHYDKKEAFFKEYANQVQKLKSALYTILSAHLAKIEQQLWQEAKRSKEIYEYFKKLPRHNTLSSYSLINLMISKNLIAANEVEHYRKLAKYFEKSEGKDIILFSKDYSLASIIETTNRATNKMWKYQAFPSMEPMMKHLEKSLPDILFFDYDMFKELKKDTFIQYVSESDNFKKLIVKGRIILLTEKESENVVALARQLKVNKLVKKPLTETKYIELVNRN